MEFKRTELKLKIYGEDCVLRFPVMREFQQFQRKAQSVGDDADKSLELTKEFLCSLGLREELFFELEPAHMDEIIKAVTQNQKKS